MNRLFVGMDAHKEKIVVVGLPGEGSHPVLREDFGGGNIPRLVKRMQTLSKTWHVEACYEAGPSGYALARVLSKAGISCRVVAPSMIPRRPGNRVKTDVQDAKELALALRAGTLEFVRIPAVEEEEVRGLVRCREDVAREVRLFKMTVSHWLQARGIRTISGTKRWSPVYWKWLRALPLSSMDRTTLDHYLDVLCLLEDRRKHIEEQICALSEEEPYRDRVRRLVVLRGFSPLAAMRLIAEVMEFGRFRSAPAFMKFTGLTPSEYSSGDRISGGRSPRRATPTSGMFWWRPCNGPTPRSSRESLSFAAGRGSPVRFGRSPSTARSGCTTSFGCWPGVACPPARSGWPSHGNWRGSSGR